MEHPLDKITKILYGPDIIFQIDAMHMLCKILRSNYVDPKNQLPLILLCIMGGGGGGEEHTQLIKMMILS